ncbi:hypothetical protein F3J37_27425 [Pantoea sp. Al-1710]|uniref:Uncharacterized protein n=1 Tax=Candidatus Pantoea communis TaxID=2608354 RepID=A0ABX0S342_9GAMM|nr:hypothetical protein [Pantoea sp. Taur]NIG22375.1 hypothetical protein [Pantoea communis]
MPCGLAPPLRGIHSNILILAGRRNAGCLPVNEVQLPSSANLRWLLADAPPHRGIRSDFENVCGAGCLPVSKSSQPYPLLGLLPLRRVIAVAPSLRGIHRIDNNLEHKTKIINPDAFGDRVFLIGTLGSFTQTKSPFG